MTIDRQPPCSACREDSSRGYNTICLNVGGEKVNIDFSDEDDCVIGGNILQKRWGGDAGWKYKPFTPNKDLPCMGESKRRPPSDDEDDVSTAPSQRSGANSDVRAGGSGDWCMMRLAGCFASEEETSEPDEEVPAAAPPTRRAKRRDKGSSMEETQWKYVGPPWYTALSDVQLKVVNSLAAALKLDIEEGGRDRTMKALYELGLTPMPTRGQIHAAMVACIIDVKSLRRKANGKDGTRLGEWSKYEGGSDHAMKMLTHPNEGSSEDEESLLGVVEYEEEDATPREDEPWHCRDSTTPSTGEPTEDDYGEEAGTDTYLFHETRWCDWCGECNTHCAAFLPPAVCEEADDGDGAEAEETKETDECSTKCDWCGECLEHCSSNIPPTVCDEKEGEEQTTTEEDQKPKCDWCGNCTEHCPSLMLSPVCEEDEAEEGEGELIEEWCEGEEEGEEREDGEEEVERRGGEGEVVEEAVGEDGANSAAKEESEEERTEDVENEEEHITNEGSRETKESRSRRKITISDSRHMAQVQHLRNPLPRAMSRAPLQIIIPFNVKDTSALPLEINVDPVEFLISLYYATGEYGGRVWESASPQRDRLLLSSAAHLQLPRTIEWLDKILPRRLRADDYRVCTEAGGASTPKKKNQFERESAKLKILCKKETRRYGKSPYLTYFQVTEDDLESTAAIGNYGMKAIKRVRCRSRRGSGPHKKIEDDFVLLQVMEGLKRVYEDFGDPIARLPFAWKLPELRLWIDKRRRKSDPLFASRRPKMTRRELDKLLEFSKNEWNNLKTSKYQFELPKIPAKLKRIRGFNMNHFKMARKQGEKMRRLCIQQFKKIVLEENRDYWPTMCPYASLPVPWKTRPQTPPPPPEPQNFRRAYNCYLPARERDVVLV